MELWVGVITVAGTLLGAIVAHILQNRTADRRETETNRAAARRDLRQATARLLSETTGLRRLQFGRWALRGATSAERTTAKDAALEARSRVTEALVEVQLLTDDTTVRRLLDELLDSAFTLHDAADQDDMDLRADRARAAHNDLVAVVGRLVRA
ncbi:hypothetical protein ACIOUE_37945 [Streptomyces xanthochromogenes]|uniref:hypothetical protein n=1 Tax=Streptomyces xanthochromogenes TaxID=67384 RepID=UPI0037FA42CB